MSGPRPRRAVRSAPARTPCSPGSAPTVLVEGPRLIKIDQTHRTCWTSVCDFSLLGASVSLSAARWPRSSVLSPLLSVGSLLSLSESPFLLRDVVRDQIHP